MDPLHLELLEEIQQGKACPDCKSGLPKIRGLDPWNMDCTHPWHENPGSQPKDPLLDLTIATERLKIELDRAARRDINRCLSLAAHCGRIVRRVFR